jgi:4Fe-4S single cluster domain of Ferredoxin I
MEPGLQAQLAFFLTGRRPGEQLDAIEGLDLRPALFAGYRDLTTLRYDFPLVLVQEAMDGACVQTLSAVIDRILDGTAHGADGDRLRKHILQQERQIRALIAAGATGTLAALWDMAASRLISGQPGRTAELMEDSLNRARAGLEVDGELIDCDVDMPARLVRHVWSMLHEKKARRFRREIERLTLKLEDILQAEFLRSKAGRSARILEASVGASYGDAFDFDAMSRMLAKATPEILLPEGRRHRIVWLLEVLKAQRFFPAPNVGGNEENRPAPYSFVFAHCNAAFDAYRERLPKMIELAKAMAMAALEVESDYVEARHDALFQGFGENGLDPKELALFPDYLVCVSAQTLQPSESARLTEMLSANMPVKVLVRTDDLSEESPPGGERVAFSLRSKQLASMTVGLNDVFVLQSSGSNLFQYRERILKGLGCSGPALFSVFSGASGKASGLPPYLTAAAAMESRAFPAFTYDPSAGSDWASRFSLADNPQAELDWPVQGFAYEDEAHQRIAEDVAFTLVDFLACDRRYAQHFARVPRAKWNGTLASVSECVTGETRGVPDKVPCLPMVDPNNVLQKVVADNKLIREARRCRDMWHSMQELAGINNSHALQLLARERKVWQEQREAETRSRETTTIAPTPTSASTAPATVAVPAPAEPAQEQSSDAAYIETARCTSCDECTHLNNKMFAYDANKQAYIANPDAGTYLQLVEAAESCQVSIIHPGKPRNPNEPGLEELLKRAQPFL